MPGQLINGYSMRSGLSSPSLHKWASSRLR